MLEVVAGGSGEYRFDVPAEVPAGLVRVAVSNNGTQEHHAQVFRLNDEAALADLQAALATGDPAAALEVGTFMGGTGLVSPGEESRAEAVVDLDPGDYALLCFVPGPDGLPHVAHGMVQPFAATPVDDPAPAPDVDGEVRLTDYRFEAPESLPGDSVLVVANDAASEAHEMVVARLDDDVTVDDVVAALRAHQPLPAVGVGGMQAILPGTRQWLRLDLDPGRYVLLCAVTSPDGTPHYEAGMVQEITVT